jgi:hypothetical protein
MTYLTIMSNGTYSQNDQKNAFLVKLAVQLVKSDILLLVVTYDL